MIMGICLNAGGFQASFVSGSKAAPILEAREICQNPETADLARSASWYDNRFTQLITNQNPDEVIAKIHFDVKNQKGLLNHGFPLGVLGKCCHTADLKLSLVTVQKLKSVKSFGLAKGTSTYLWIDQIKDQKPYWKDAGRISALAATIGL